MVLTDHQLFHLNAIVAEANETKNLSNDKKKKWMKSKKVKEGKEEKYLKEIEKDVEKIKEDGYCDFFHSRELFINGEIVVVDNAAMIHDYIEKETKESFKNG